MRFLVILVLVVTVLVVVSSAPTDESTLQPVSSSSSTTPSSPTTTSSSTTTSTTAKTINMTKSIPTPMTSSIPILRQTADGPNPDGSYSYSFETSNGIKTEGQGQLKNIGTETEALTTRGGYSWIAPDGTPISISYVADEFGFRPIGNVLPVAPPVPEAISRALEWIATHPRYVDQDEMEEKNIIIEAKKSN